MKFVVLALLTGGGVLGGLFRGPVLPLLVYIFFGVFRPQFLWSWELDSYPAVQWSFILAIATILLFPLWTYGVVGGLHDPLRRVYPRFTAPHVFMALFGVWMTLSYLFAGNQDAAWVVYWDFLKILIIYLVASQVVRSVGQVWAMYILITAALGYIAVDVNHEYIRSQYIVLYKRGYAGLDNNGAGLMIAMGVPLLYFAWELTVGWHRWFYLFAIPPAIHATVSSYSRGAMLSLLLTAPLYFIFTRKRKFLATCYLAVAVMMPFMAGKEIEERFLSVSEAEADGSFQSRLQSWAAAVRIANDFPLFGAGIRNANLLSYWYGADMEGRTIHSNYLQIAADCGWGGLAVYLALFGTTLFSIWRLRVRLWNSPHPDAVRTVAMLGGIECSLWVFMVGCSALSMEAFELPYFLLFLGAQLWAIANATVTPDRRREWVPPAAAAVRHAAAPPPTPPPAGETPPPAPGSVRKPPTLPTRADVSGVMPASATRRPT